MSFDPSILISTGVTTATSEVDIAICPTKICLVVAAANDATLGPQKIFFSGNGGGSWQTTTLPLNGDEKMHLHPSIGWTSDQKVWIVTMVSPVLTNDLIPGSTFLRCYHSEDGGAHWELDENFNVTQTTIQSAKIWVHQSSPLFGTNTVDPKPPDLLDTIYVIWASGNSVFVKWRHPQTGVWQDADPPLDSQSAVDVSGCDIKSDPSEGLVAAFWHGKNQDGGKIFCSVSKTNDLQNGPIFGTTTPVAKASASPKLFIPACASNGAAISVSSIYKGSSAFLVWADFTDDGTKTRIWSQGLIIDGIGNIIPSGDRKMIHDPVDSTGLPLLVDQFHPRISYDLLTNTSVVIYYATGTGASRLTTFVAMQTSDGVGGWELSPPLAFGGIDETTAGFNHYQYGDYIGLAGGVRGFLFAAWTDRPSGLAEQIRGSRIRFPPIPEPCGSDPILSNATITFDTTTDNKDDNTTLDVSLASVYGWEVAATAHLEEGAGNIEFKDPSSHQLILNIDSNSHFLVPKSRLLRGKIDITIAPKGVFGGDGSDTWNFNFILELKFTNGDLMRFQNPEFYGNPPDNNHISLSEHSKTISHSLNELIVL
jgi:hypothetical protein